MTDIETEPGTVVPLVGTLDGGDAVLVPHIPAGGGESPLPLDWAEVDRRAGTVATKATNEVRRDLPGLIAEALRAALANQAGLQIDAEHATLPELVSETVRLAFGARPADAAEVQRIVAEALAGQPAPAGGPAQLDPTTTAAMVTEAVNAADLDHLVAAAVEVAMPAATSALDHHIHETVAGLMAGQAVTDQITAAVGRAMAAQPAPPNVAEVERIATAAASTAAAAAAPPLDVAEVQRIAQAAAPPMVSPDEIGRIAQAAVTVPEALSPADVTRIVDARAVNQGQIENMITAAVGALPVPVSAEEIRQMAAAAARVTIAGQLPVPNMTYATIDTEGADGLIDGPPAYPAVHHGQDGWVEVLDDDEIGTHLPALDHPVPALLSLHWLGESIVQQGLERRWNKYLRFLRGTVCWVIVTVEFGRGRTEVQKHRFIALRDVPDRTPPLDLSYFESEPDRAPDPDEDPRINRDYWRSIEETTLWTGNPSRTDERLNSVAEPPEVAAPRRGARRTQRP